MRSIVGKFILFLSWLTVLFIMGCVPAFAAETIPAHAAAAATAPVSTGAAFVGFLNSVVFPIVGALVSALLTILITRLNTKYKLGITTDKNSFLFKLAAQGVALAEEKAARLAGSAAALTGNQKLDIAVAHILSFFPKISPEKAQDIVHAVLAQIPGAGATGEAVTLLPQEGGYSVPPLFGEEISPTGPTVQTGLTTTIPAPAVP